MLFLYSEVLNGQALQQLPGFEEVDADLVAAILEEAGRFAENVLLPINREGDEVGCVFADGEVTTPPGFREAYRQFSESGWGALAMDLDYGGQGLPKMLHMLVDEMFCSTNLSLGLYPGLTNGAYAAMAAYASDELKTTYFPKMAEGSWSASMCLTEAQCGTDLGLIRTKAEPQADDTYHINGSKIFITGGEHDLTDNILHLVLARTPDAPAGIKGISLFLVPKILVNADGELGERNGVTCGSIEHKMGIKASSTCVMNFDNAVGYLVGELNQGMRAMFKMMNTERLAVGVQGIGIGEAAYQNAVAYAKDRLQGRALTGAEEPDKAADPLTVHPDIRRMLLTIRAYTEGGRALAAWVGMQLDTASHHPDAEKREAASDLVALLTPVVKAFCTDTGFESANLGMQCFGGHGYIREWGMEQLVRDCRIAQIYEGANGVQAMDLVGRKLPANDGRAIKDFIALVQNWLENNTSEYSEPLGAAVKDLQLATQWLAEQGSIDPNHVGAAANDYLRILGLVSLAYLWAQMDSEANARSGDSDPFYATKRKTAKFYFQRLLPQVKSLSEQLKSGADNIMAVADNEW